MRLRKTAIVVGAGLVVGLIAALSTRTAPRLPQVSLIQLTRTNVNRLDSPADPFSWSAGNLLGDLQEVWNAEFEICNPKGSGILLSHEKFGVEFLASTGNWTAALDAGASQALTAFLHRTHESSLQINMRRVRVSIPSETRRCRLVARFRPLSAQERCRQLLVNSGLWGRFPGPSRWISDRLPSTKRWKEWRPEIELPRVPLGQEPHNEAPAPNRRPRFPPGVSGGFAYAVCAPSASPATVGEARR